MFLKMLEALSLPSSLIGLLCIVGAALCACRRKMGALFFAAGGLLLLAVFCLPIDMWMLRPLENRFTQTMPPMVDGLIVLGGALSPQVTASRHEAVTNGDADRLIAFIALARRFPAAKLVYTGGSPFPLGGMTEAAATSDLIASLGLDPDRVMFEKSSRTTWENAVDAMALVHPAPGTRWLLVTSAYHMPRAMGAFRKIGWPGLTAWPVAFRTTESGWPAPVQPLSHRLAGIDLAAHEWAGLFTYWLLDRTDHLFPG